jgi:glycosyltransferase involved in cell wall biosynthesis
VRHSGPSRVLYVLNGTIGGANLSIQQLAPRLPPDRYEACVVYPRGLADGAEALRDAVPRAAPAYLPTWMKYLGHPAWKRAVWAGGQLAKSALYLRPIAQLRALCARWNVRIIHTNTSTTLCSALAARVLGLPHVWHVRELLGPGRPFQFPPTDAASARIFARLSTRLVANSEGAAAFFRQHLGPRSITVIPNGIPEPTEDVEALGRRLRERLGIPAEARVVGMVGSLHSELKRHPFFLDAALPVAAANPHVYIVLFGGVPPTAYADRIRRRVEALPFRDRVLLPGHIPDVWSVMGAIDVLGHGTDDEGFGRVFVEAMLAGKPVVAPRGGGALQIVDEAVTGFLVSPRDPTEMQSRLQTLVMEPEACRRLGEAGRARARALFSMDALVDRLCRVYDEVLEAGVVAGASDTT